MNSLDMGSYPVEQGTFFDCGEFSRKQSRCHLNWNIKPINRKEFRAKLSRREFDRVVFSELEHAPISGTRRLSDINGRDDSFIGLTLLEKGTLEFNQGGHELVLQSHDLFLWDGTRPGSLRSLGIMECKTILFPRKAVYQQIGNIDHLTGKKLEPDSGTGLLLKAHVDALHTSIAFMPPRDRPGVLAATLNLVVACFRSSEDVFQGSSHRKVLFRRIEEFMRDTLLEPMFNPTTIASAFGFSPRYLHRIFADAGTTFSEWVRNERLTRAERSLACSSYQGESITQIAHQFGFCDAAHFCNLFKARYGKTPREYRLFAKSQTHLTQKSGAPEDPAA